MGDPPTGSPAPSGLRARNVEARRQRILTAARRLITSHGIAGLSMRKLAREAGLSVTTLYNLFGVREDILQALVLEAIDRMDDALDREAPLDDPIERCRAIVTLSVRHMVENEAMFRPMMVAAQQAMVEGRRSDDGAVTRRAAGMQALAIQTAIDRGMVRDLLDPFQLGSQIYHGYEFAALQWATGAIDARGFEARALFGLVVALLGVARGSLRSELEAELLELQRRLAKPKRRSRRRVPA